MRWLVAWGVVVLCVCVASYGVLAFVVTGDPRLLLLLLAGVFFAVITLVLAEGD